MARLRRDPRDILHSTVALWCSPQSPGHTVSTSISLWMIVLLVVVCCSLGLSVSTTSNQTMVVTKTLLSGACKDNNNVVVGNGAEWSSGCNKVVCHVEVSGNYTVTHGCRAFVPSENPDTTNCVLVSNPASPYPSCCPRLQCGAAALPSTINPTLCYDLSSPRTCSLWKELSSNCSDRSAFVYNFTLVYCRLSCGFCLGGSG